MIWLALILGLPVWAFMWGVTFKLYSDHDAWRRARIHDQAKPDANDWANAHAAALIVATLWPITLWAVLGTHVAYKKPVGEARLALVRIEIERRAELETWGNKELDRGDEELDRELKRERKRTKRLARHSEVIDG